MSKQVSTAAIASKITDKQSQVKNAKKESTEHRQMRFQEKSHDFGLYYSQSQSCQPKQGMDTIQERKQLRISTSLQPASSKNNIGNGSKQFQKLPQSCQNKTNSAQQSTKGCFLSAKNGDHSKQSSSKGSLFFLNPEGISLKKQEGSRLNRSSNTSSNGNIQGTKKIIKKDKELAHSENETIQNKGEQIDPTTQGNIAVTKPTRSSRASLCNTTSHNSTETVTKTKKTNQPSKQQNTLKQNDVESIKENINHIEDIKTTYNSNNNTKDQCESIKQSQQIIKNQDKQSNKPNNEEKPIESLRESILGSTIIGNGSQQQTTQMDSAYTASYQLQQQPQHSQLKGLMTPPASLSTTSRGKQQHSNYQNVNMNSSNLKNECGVMSESIGWKRASEFSLVESTSHWSCAKCCIWSEEQDKRMRELKTKYHLRDALQRQHLHRLLIENTQFQEKIVMLQKEIDSTAQIRPLEIAHIKRLTNELTLEKNKYLQGIQPVQVPFAGQYNNIESYLQQQQLNLPGGINYNRSNSSSQIFLNQSGQQQQQDPMERNNQIMVLLRRISEQEEIIARLSTEVSDLQSSKNQLEEGLKNVLLATQLQILKQKNVISQENNNNDQSLHNSQTISFEISQQKPSCLSSEVSLQKAFGLSSTLQDLPCSLPQSIQLNLNPPRKLSNKSNTNNIEEPEKSKISMSESLSSSYARKNSNFSVQQGQEGFIFGPPKNASICSMEEMLRTQCQDNERVIFLEEREDNQNQNSQLQSCVVNNYFPQQLYQSQQISTGNKLIISTINEKQQQQQYPQKEQSQLFQTQGQKDNFQWDSQKQEFVIDESQLAFLIENYKKSMAEKNKIS